MAKTRWQDRWFTGHVSFGPRWLRVTIYGANAMHWAVNVWVSRLGVYCCFHPSTRTFGYRWPWYFYASHNATPWAAVTGFGPGFERHDRELLAARRAGKLDGEGTSR